MGATEGFADNVTKEDDHDSESKVDSRKGARLGTVAYARNPSNLGWGVLR